MSLPPPIANTRTLLLNNGRVESSAPFYVNASTCGTVGNGSSNPANGAFANLAALQAFYGTTVGGVTIALTNELDWLGIQKAIDIAYAAGGGTAFIPGPGPYVLSNSNSVSDGSGTLIVKSTGSVPQGAGTSVNILGDGMQTTVLSWPADLGSGRAALSCDSPAATHTSGTGRFGFNFYEGTFRDFHLKGPGAGATIVPGTSPANMDGIVIGARRHSAFVAAEGFHSAWNVNGDYIEFETCYGFNSYYGMYFADANTQLYGDHTIRRCMFNANAAAGFGVSKNGQMLGIMARSVYVGGQPYGILLEAGTPDSYGQPNPASAVVGCRFERSNFEFQGNQFILDDNATVGGGGNTGTMTRSVIDTTFDTPNISIQGTTWSSGGRGTYAYVNVAGMFGVRFTNMVGGSFLCPSSSLLAAFLVDSIGVSDEGVIFEGDLDTILPTYATSGTPFLKAAAGTFDNIGIFGNGGHRCLKMVKPGEWSGNPEYLASAAAIPLYAIMERVNYNEVQPGGTATPGTAPIAGINKQSWPSSSNGKLTIVATNAVLTEVLVTAAQTNGGLVKMSSASNGAAVTAISVTDGQIVGWVQNYNGGSTSSVLISPLWPGSASA